MRVCGVSPPFLLFPHAMVGKDVVVHLQILFVFPCFSAIHKTDKKQDIPTSLKSLCSIFMTTLPNLKEEGII